MVVVNMAVYLALTLIPYWVSGANLLPLWQPLDFLMILGIYVSFYIGMVGWYLPSKIESPKAYEAGRTALVPAMVIPMLLSFIHAADYYAIASADGFRVMVSTSLVAPFYSVLIFISFFARFNQSAKLNLTTQSLDHTNTKKNKMVA